jgi:Domain of unknown function (DUF4386)
MPQCSAPYTSTWGSVSASTSGIFTGIWSVLIGVGVIQGAALPTWLGWPGLVIGIGLAVGSAEFLGPNEESGWGLAGAGIPVLYVAWSAWLLGIGIALIA